MLGLVSKESFKGLLGDLAVHSSMGLGVKQREGSKPKKLHLTH